ncbi:MAG: hypothetical protein AAF916_01515 [Planctomycetota bacterium]
MPAKYKLVFTSPTGTGAVNVVEQIEVGGVPVPNYTGTSPDFTSASIFPQTDRFAMIVNNLGGIAGFPPTMLFQQAGPATDPAGSPFQGTAGTCVATLLP